MKLSAKPGPRLGSHGHLVSLEVEFIVDWIHLIMHSLRKSRSSGDIPASVPTFPANLVRKLVSKRDPKALALSSATIGLSIGSAFSTRSASVDVNPSRGRDSGWQTAYAAARMAVEVAKESSDAFPPLKAVVGAISVLIQNYDVSVPALFVS